MARLCLLFACDALLRADNEAMDSDHRNGFLTNFLVDIFRHIIFTIFGLLFCLQTALSQVDGSIAFEIEILYQTMPSGQITTFTIRNDEIVFDKLSLITTDTTIGPYFIPQKGTKLVLNQYPSDSIVSVILSTNWSIYPLIRQRNEFDGYRISIKTSIGSEKIEAKLGLYQDPIIQGLIEYAINSIPNKNIRKRYQVHFE